jgi:hypothetical protein
MIPPEYWLHQAVEQSAAITAWPNTAGSAERPPYAVYRRTTTERTRVTTGPTCTATAAFEVEVYADTYTETKRLAEQLRLGIDGTAGTFKTPAGEVILLDVAIVDEADGEPVFYDGREKPTYLVIQSYSIRFQEQHTK